MFPERKIASNRCGAPKTLQVFVSLPGTVCCAGARIRSQSRSPVLLVLVHGYNSKQMIHIQYFQAHERTAATALLRCCVTFFLLPSGVLPLSWAHHPRARQLDLAHRPGSTRVYIRTAVSHIRGIMCMMCGCCEKLVYTVYDV